MEHSTLLSALASSQASHGKGRTQRRIRTAGSLIFVIALVLLFSACTTAGEQAQPGSPSVPDVETSTTTSAPDSTTSTTTEPTTPASTSTTSVPAQPDEELETTSITRPIEDFPNNEPVLSGTAARPSPVEITQPTPPTASFIVGPTDTEITISFAADGNGQIEWFTQVLPSGPPTYRGKAPTIDITLTISEAKDSESYLVTADGKNPRAGEDSITILLVRGSS